MALNERNINIAGCRSRINGSAALCTFERYRIAESLAMTALVWLVAVLGGYALTGFIVSKTTAVLSIALALHFVSIYAANSWLGYRADAANPRLAAQSGADPLDFAVVAVSLGGLSVVLYYLVGGSRVAVAGFASHILWLAYSAPRVGLKTRPPLGTLAHLVGGALHGAMLVWTYDGRFGAYWHECVFSGLLFASGHLIHEGVDAVADRDADVRTGISIWGAKTSLLGVSLLLFAALALGVSAATQTGDAWRWGPVCAAASFVGLLALRLLRVKDIGDLGVASPAFVELRRIHRVAFGIGIGLAAVSFGFEVL